MRHHTPLKQRDSSDKKLGTASLYLDNEGIGCKCLGISCALNYPADIFLPESSILAKVITCGRSL